MAVNGSGLLIDSVRLAAISGARKAVLIGAVTLDLAILVVWKYTDFSVRPSAASRGYGNGRLPDRKALTRNRSVVQWRPAHPGRLNRDDRV